MIMDASTTLLDGSQNIFITSADIEEEKRSLLNKSSRTRNQNSKVLS